MKKLSTILLVAVLAFAMVAMSVVCVSAEGNALSVGNNPVSAGTAEEKAEYTFTAAEAGKYIFTVIGTDDYQVGLVGETVYNLFEGDTIPVLVGAAEGEVAIVIETSEEPDALLLVVGENKDVAVSAEGTIVQVIAEKAGTYTISSTNSNITFGVQDAVAGVDTLGVNSTEAGLGENIYFILGTENWEDDVADITISYEETDVSPAISAIPAVVGENKDIAVSATEATVLEVIAENGGVYTATAAEGVTVGVMNAYTLDIDNDTNSVKANKGENVYFVLTAAEDVVTTVTIEYAEDTDAEVTTVAAQVGDNEVTVPANSAVVLEVIAEASGTYTVSAADVTVGVMNPATLDVDNETASVEAIKGESVYFVISNDTEEDVTATVTITFAPVEDEAPADNNGAPQTGDVAVIVAVVAVISLCGIAVAKKYEVRG